MARALIGYLGNNSEQVLALQVARLRHRVTELEAELETLKATASSASLDLELHRIAQDAEPVLA